MSGSLTLAGCCVNPGSPSWRLAAFATPLWPWAQPHNWSRRGRRLHHRFTQAVIPRVRQRDAVIGKTVVFSSLLAMRLLICLLEGCACVCVMSSTWCTQRPCHHSVCSKGLCAAQSNSCQHMAPSPGRQHNHHWSRVCMVHPWCRMGLARSSSPCQSQRACHPLCWQCSHVEHTCLTVRGCVCVCVWVCGSVTTECTFAGAFTYSSSGRWHDGN